MNSTRIALDMLTSLGKSKRPQVYSKNCRQERNAASGRSNLPFRKSSYACFLMISYMQGKRCVRLLSSSILSLLFYPVYSCYSLHFLSHVHITVFVIHEFNQSCLCDHCSAALKRSPVSSQVGTQVKTVIFPFLKSIRTQ